MKKGCSCSEETVCLLVVLFIVLLIPAIVLLALYVNPDNPSFSVEDFYVPAFDTTSQIDTIDTIYFDIKLQNRNKAIGLYYDQPINITISYSPILTNHQFIWQYSVPKFYQGNHHSRRLIDVIQMPPGVNMSMWNQTVVGEQVGILPFGAMVTGFEPFVFFKIDIVSRVRFKLLGRNHGKDVVMSRQVPVQSNTGGLIVDVKHKSDQFSFSFGGGGGWESGENEKERRKRKSKRG